VAQDFANKGINAVDFIFQTGSAIGANEFAITKVETVDPTSTVVWIELAAGRRLASPLIPLRA